MVTLCELAAIVIVVLLGTGAIAPVTEPLGWRAARRLRDYRGLL